MFSPASITHKLTALSLGLATTLWTSGLASSGIFGSGVVASVLISALCDECFADTPAPEAPSARANVNANAPEAVANTAVEPDKVVLDENQTNQSIAELRGKNLMFPIKGVDPSSVQGSWSQRRGKTMHHAVDIPAARNTPIYAVGDGKIAKLWQSKYGGNTIYEFDPSNRYSYYYAHLEAYADGLKEGDAVKKGQLIGYVGTSGDAPANSPHLHFSFSLLQTPGVWWPGGSVDPYQVFKDAKAIAAHPAPATQATAAQAAAPLPFQKIPQPQPKLAGPHAPI